ncbi:tetratricopeptide repeat-containing sensor histidine kinase [Tenacibaculum holothuriorum]|uniref:tetratricopeptide repeat-containing sensor histidine kinase n=1 Tax=Tenacibaculum holothuriorum TaxID=1635173 RepID=UPI001180E61F|nr:tetratricopeptide repeat-containing sensor histidine kinase [Tenacibaculum holothuriorum]
MSEIAYRFYILKDTVNFLKLNKKAQTWAIQRKDTFTIADTHWSYAYYYKNDEIYDKAYQHYNEAFQNFKFIKEEYKMARMLFAMAFIKGLYRDYAGSEVQTLQSIKIFKRLINNEWLYRAYNHLGLLQIDIKEYDKALFYFNKSLEYFSKIENKEKVYLASYNNIGNVYLEKGLYKKAIETYNIDLKNKVSLVDYATLIDNKALAKLYLKDTNEIKNTFFKALSIRDSLKNKTGILTSKLNISNYYKYLNDTINAIKYANEALILAKELKNGRDYLASLNQLANLDIYNQKKYFDRYIEFNDSLVIAERRTQNKFTRIEFETDEYIAETKRLNQQRIWIIVTSIGGILILSLLYFLRVQKVRNEKLLLEAEQQQANEEVYVLTLQQQAKLEEERINERNRISAELHDSILGKLFGTRVNLGFLAMAMQPETQVKHQSFLDELQDIEKEIRDVSHKLSDNFDSSNVNFTNIIEQLLKDKSALGNFKYQFNFDENIVWKNITEITKVNLYRIIQEALQNIIKHAKAKNVILGASIKKNVLQITLQDDGIGFNTEKKKKGIGIKNINSRVVKIGGTIDLLSEENKGTTLVIKIPL